MDEKRPISQISLFKSSLFRLKLYIKRCRIASRIFWNNLNSCSWFRCRVIEEKRVENWTKKCHRAHGFWKRHFHYRLRIRPNLQGMFSVISWITRLNLIQFWSTYSTKISVKECFLPLTFFNSKGHDLHDVTDGVPQVPNGLRKYQMGYANIQWVTQPVVLLCLFSRRHSEEQDRP